MANLYGVANAPGLPVIISNFGSATVCPANTGTVFVTSPALIAPSQGYFYAMFWCQLIIVSGASINTGMNLSYQIGGGSTQVFGSMGAYGLTASGTNYVPFAGFTAPSQVAWQGAGSTVALGISPAGQGITIQPLSNAVFALFRAPDQ